MIKYTISDNNLHLIDSYKVHKKDFAKELNEIKKKEPDYLVWNRGVPQMCLEWSCHNFLYMLGLWRSRTKDVDLNYPQSFLIRAVYAVCGCFAWLFIK